LACAAGCDVLWRAAGAIAGGGVVWFRGGQVRGPGASPPCLPCLTAWVGAREAGLDSGDVQEHGYRAGANVNSDAHSEFNFNRIFAHQVFDQMPARI
jgi:hypothetical protein